MKNPLRKRLPRELKGELGKYLVVFILMVLTIGMVSGFLVADGSMIVAYNDGFEKYNIENGNFRTNQQIYKSQKEEDDCNGNDHCHNGSACYGGGCLDRSDSRQDEKYERRVSCSQFGDFNRHDHSVFYGV